MSWTGDTANAGFSTVTPFRALSGNVATHNAASQAADPNSLLSFYKSLIALRQSLPSLARGSYEFPAVAGSVMSYQRSLGSERSVVVINYGTASAAVALTRLPANAQLAAVFPHGASDTSVDAGGSAIVTLAAQSVAVYRLR